MLYNGERVGTGVEPKVDVAVAPSTARLLAKMACPTPSPPRRSPNEARCTTRRRASFIGEDSRRPRGARRDSTSIPPCARTCAASRRQALPHRGPHRGRARPRTPQQADRRDSRAGARIKLNSHGDIAGGIAPAMEETGSDVLMGTAALRKPSSWPAPSRRWAARYNASSPPAARRSAWRVRPRALSTSACSLWTIW